MANTNFITEVARAEVKKFKTTVVKAAKENSILLVNRVASGKGQVWQVSDTTTRPKPTVTAYSNGQIMWQNLNPTRIGIDCKILKRWGNK